MTTEKESKEATRRDTNKLDAFILCLAVQFLVFAFTMLAFPYSLLFIYFVLGVVMHSIPLHLVGVFYYIVHIKRFRGEWRRMLVMYLVLAVLFLVFMVGFFYHSPTSDFDH